MIYVLDVVLHLLDGTPFTSRDANVHSMDNSNFAAAADFLPAFLPTSLDEQLSQTRPSTAMSPFRSSRRLLSAAPWA